MTEKSADITRVSSDEALKVALDWATPARLAALDAMTDQDIADQIAGNADAAPELTDEWFEDARLVTPLRGRRSAA